MLFTVAMPLEELVLVFNDEFHCRGDQRRRNETSEWDGRNGDLCVYVVLRTVYGVSLSFGIERRGKYR